MDTTTSSHRPIKQLCQLVRFKSTQIFILAGSVLLTLLITIICIGLTVRYEVEHEVANVADVDYWKDRVSPEQKLWYDKGIEELNIALKVNSIGTVVKNVRIFVIDGIEYRDLATHRFSHINSNSNENFIWDQFPHMARFKNPCSKPCPRREILQALWMGLPLEAFHKIEKNYRRQENEENSELLSVLRQAQVVGLRTGFVTNQRLTGATGAALFAQITNNLTNECNEELNEESISDNLAEQLISSETGKYLNVIMGGGRQMFNHEVPVTNLDPIDNQLCRASNESNLLKTWRLQKLRQIKEEKQFRFELVQQFDELSALNGSKYDYLMAVLSNGDLSGNLQVSSFQMMLNKTLQVLNRFNDGYVLIIEQVVKPKMVKKEQLQMLNETLSSLTRDRNTLNLVLFMNTEDVLPTDSLLFAEGPKSSIFYGVRDASYLTQAVAYALKNKR